MYKWHLSVWIICWLYSGIDLSIWAWTIQLKDFPTGTFIRCVPTSISAVVCPLYKSWLKYAWLVEPSPSMFLTVLLTENYLWCANIGNGESRLSNPLFTNDKYSLSGNGEGKKKPPNNTINDMDYINGLFRCVLATWRRMFSYQCCITLSFIHRNKMCLRVSFFLFKFYLK